ncbi:hypothetical protein [Bradyrhizobium sp. WSM1417]|uniref:hypothetical protein n=1 Tax=Bradyrhizobium sp. WSM1417 TaxID=754500 RepID=UPI00048110F6|nr:hypothetical protein [Bradyrhizobium sp. WSM1417]
MDYIFKISALLVDIHWALRLVAFAGIAGLLGVFGPTAILRFKPEPEASAKPQNNASAQGANNTAMAIGSNAGTIYAGPVTINSPSAASDKAVLQRRLARETMFFISESLLQSIWLYGRDAEVRLDHPPPWPITPPAVETVDDDNELKRIVDEIDAKLGWEIDPELKAIYTEIAIMSRHLKTDIGRLHQDARALSTWNASKPLAISRLKRWRETANNALAALQKYCEYSGNEGYEDQQARRSRTNLMSFEKHLEDNDDPRLQLMKEIQKIRPPG